MSIDPQSTYYDAGGIETIDIIHAKLTQEQFRGYLLGNIIKYVCRINFKPKNNIERLRDIEKASVYIVMLKDLLNNNLS